MSITRQGVLQIYRNLLRTESRILAQDPPARAEAFRRTREQFKDHKGDVSELMTRIPFNHKVLMCTYIEFQMNQIQRR